MNYFLLAETDFFRLINEAGDCNMETAYTAFATQVIELCNGSMDANLTVIALAYIEIELQAPYHPQPLKGRKERECRLCQQGRSFIRKMQKFLATPQVPPLISANNTTETTTPHCNGRAMPSTSWNLSTASTRWAASTTATCRSNSLPRSFTRYSGLSRRTATVSTPISNAGRTKAAPTSLTECRRN